MNSIYFAISFIAFLFILAIQLIRMNIYIIKLKKDKDLLKVIIKEENNWAFIKGLY